MKRNRLKPSYFTITAANMLLFILLCAYITLDWTDFVCAYTTNQISDINLQIGLRCACEIAVTVLLLLWARPVPALKLNAPKPSDFILSAVLALFLYVPMAVLLSFLNYIVLKSGFEPAPNEVADAVSKTPFIVEFLFFCVLAPICEEFLFRGAILNAYRRKMGFAAIFVSSLIFGAMHAEIFSIINGFIIGCALGYVYLKTNSIWCPVILHLFYNLFAFTLIPDMFIVDLPWTSGVFDLSLMTFEEPGYCVYQAGIAVIGVLASALTIRKISLSNSRNIIVKDPDYVKTPAGTATTAVIIMLLFVRAAASYLGYFI